jgi:DNA-binding CsgD family transcriptional regulator/tetratricopeptide (TPR) repeat protein
VLDRLDAAVAARIIEPHGPLGQYQFSHALIQETLYIGLGTARRMQLHQEIGAALEEQGRGDPASLLTELAYHFEQAAPLGTAAKAVTYALAAAERAMAQAAWESAVGHYQQALRAFDLLAEPADPARYCETLLALGEAQNRAAAGRSVTFMDVGAGGSPGARETFLRAARFAQEAGLAELLARAALGLSGFNPYAHQGGVEGLQLMDHALTMLPDVPTALRARLLARASMDRYMLMEMGKLPFAQLSIERIRLQTTQAVAMARQVNDLATLGYTLLMQGSQSEFHALPARLAAAEEVIQLAEGHGDQLLLTWGLQLKAVVLERGGAVSEARALLDEMELIAEELRVPYFSWRVRIHHAAVALRAGDLAGAERWMDRAAEIQPHSGVSAKMLIAVRREQGRLEELLPLVESMDASIPRSLAVRAYRILCQLETGDTLAARAAFGSTIVDEVRNPVTPLRALTLLAECCAILEDAEHAGFLYPRLLPSAGQNVISSSTDFTGGAADYYLGLLATVLGDWAAAHQHFEDAVILNDAWGMPVYAGYARYAWAEMLWKRGGATNADTVLGLLGEARTLAKAIGSVRLDGLVAALIACVRRPSTPPARLGMLLRLSRREREVLELIAAGHTDKEIADRLYISPRTVTTHVTHILNKLGVSSRVEAAELATSNGRLGD